MLQLVFVHEMTDAGILKHHSLQQSWLVQLNAASDEEYSTLNALEIERNRNLDFLSVKRRYSLKWNCSCEHF